MVTLSKTDFWLLRAAAGHKVQSLQSHCPPLLLAATARVKTLDSIQSQSQPLKGKRLNFEREILGCRHSVNCRSDMTQKVHVLQK